MFYQMPTAPVRHHVQKAVGAKREERGFWSSLLQLWSQTFSTTFHYYNRNFFSWTKVSHAWSSPVCKIETFPLATCSWDGKLYFPFCPSFGSLIANSVLCLCQLSLLTVMGKCSYSKRVNRSQLQENHLCHFPQKQQGFFFLTLLCAGREGIFLRFTRREELGSARLCASSLDSTNT